MPMTHLLLLTVLLCARFHGNSTAELEDLPRIFFLLFNQNKSLLYFQFFDFPRYGGPITNGNLHFYSESMHVPIQAASFINFSVTAPSLVSVLATGYPTAFTSIDIGLRLPDGSIPKKKTIHLLLKFKSELTNNINASFLTLWPYNPRWTLSHCPLPGHSIFLFSLPHLPWHWCWQQLQRLHLTDWHPTNLCCPKCSCLSFWHSCYSSPILHCSGRDRLCSTTHHWVILPRLGFSNRPPKGNHLRASQGKYPCGCVFVVQLSRYYLFNEIVQ